MDINIYHKIKSLLAGGQLHEATELMKETNLVPQFEKKIVTLHDRLSGLEQQRKLGLTSEEALRVEKSRLRVDIDYILETLNSEQEQASEGTSGPDTSGREKLERQIIHYLKSLHDYELAIVDQELNPVAKSNWGPDQQLEDLREKIREKQLELRNAHGYEEALAIRTETFNKNPVLSLLERPFTLKEAIPEKESEQAKQQALSIIRLDINHKQATRALAFLFQLSARMYPETDTLNRENAHKEAILYFNRLLPIDRSQVEFAIGKARSLAEFGKNQEARDLLTDALSYDPNNYLLLYELSGNVAELQDHETAIKILGECLSINPKFAPARVRLGLIYRELSEPEMAISELREALKLDPEYFEAHYELGKLFESRSEHEKAVPHLETALKLHPDHAELLNRLGHVYLILNEPEKAIPCFQKTLEIDPEKYIGSIEILANLYTEQKDYKNAIKYFSQLRKSNPNNREVLKHLALNYLKDKQLNKAMPILKKAHELDKNDISIIKALAQAYLQKEDYAKALKLYEKAIRITRNDEQVWRGLGKLYTEIKEYENALDCYKKAEKLAGEENFKRNLQDPVILEKIEVNNINFFDNFTWNCQRQVNVLLGRNGFGKSHFLRLLISLLQKEHSVSYKFFDGSPNDASVRIGVRQKRKKKIIERSNIQFETIGKIPVLAIPDVRAIDRSRDAVFLFGDDKSDLVQHGAYHFLFQKPYEGLMQNFLYELCITYLDQQQKQTRKFLKPQDVFRQLPVFRLLEEVFEELTGTPFRFHQIEPVVGSARFKIEVITEGNEDKPLPIQKASQGTLSVLSIFGMIYNYLRVVYPDTPHQDLLTGTAIVVIDELDAHLHPVWQRKLVHLLKKKFPKIQFFLTAHSPLIIGGCHENEVSVLRKTKEGRFMLEQIPENFIGWDVAQLYEKVFKVEEMDQVYYELNTRYATLNSIRQQIDAFQKKDDLNQSEKIELQQLSREEDELAMFETIKKKKEGQDYRKMVRELKATVRELEHQLEKARQDKSRKK